MKAEERAGFEKRLLVMRQEILIQEDPSIEPNRSDASAKSDEDAQALNEMSQIIASQQNRKRLGSLGQIDAALRRLRQEPEDFGLCLACEEPIAERRLQLMPYAEYCVACQGKRDSPRGGARRKLTDYQ
ncbi:MAG: TraR/DksA family transcriptional regulator [Deltaproteobacteria bacterium]|nr:TraR/DksA family transcriptional regulator [Deltaproteobacteria bacterium]